jgi:hypothetical protein
MIKTLAALYPEEYDRLIVDQEIFKRDPDAGRFPAIFARTSHPRSDKSKKLQQNLNTLFYLNLRILGKWAEDRFYKLCPLAPWPPQFLQYYPFRLYWAWGTSGAFENDEMERLLADVAHRLIRDMIIILEVGRWSHLPALGLKWFRFCRERQVHVLSARQPETWGNEEQFDIALRRDLGDFIRRCSRILEGDVKGYWTELERMVEPSGKPSDEYWNRMLIEQRRQELGSDGAVCDELNSSGQAQAMTGAPLTPRRISKLIDNRAFKAAKAAYGHR